MHLYSLGENSTWSESVLQAFEQATGHRIHRFADAASLQNHLAGAGGIPVILVENGFGSQKGIRALRDTRTRGLTVWFGKTFTKEDYVFALNHRVYLVLEGVNASDARLADAVNRAQNVAIAENDLQHLLRTLKTIILQRTGDDHADDQGTDFPTELKTVVGKLEKCSLANEWVGAAVHATTTDTRLPLHQSAVLSDALLTVADLERTGTLEITSPFLEAQGSIQFIQGKIARAQSAAVQGLKAIYRMYLWPDCQFGFARQEASDVQVDEPIALAVRDICQHGETLQREFNEIRAHVPPGSICLQLDPTILNASSRLEPDLFSALASIVEFGKVSQVLDYNLLPDVNLYKALIALRRKRLVRVVPSASA